MKKHPYRSTHTRIPLLAVSTLFALIHSAPALTVPIAQDTHSLPTAKIAPATGKAVNLVVNSKQTALLRFNILDPNAVPDAIQPGNIKSVRLRIYVTSAKFPADVLVRAVASNWQESFTGVPADFPALVPGTLATIPKAELIPKSFVQVDITETFKELLQTGNDFGFALQTADPKARLTFASKEGAATGYSAELEIIANTAIDANNRAQFDAQLRVGGAFVVENSPNPVTSYNFFAGAGAGLANTTGINNTFSGADAGLRNTTGELNTFLGSSTGQLNITGAGNTFVGGLSGFNNTASNNVFVGATAGQGNTTGGDNVFMGFAAGRFNASGTRNVAIGKSAGVNNTAGSNNTFLGNSAGTANTTESNNTFIGDNAAGAVGVSNSVAIGKAALVNASNAMVLGNDLNVGIKTSAPTSALQVNGSLSLPIRTNTDLLAGLNEDDYVLINTVNNAGVILPSTVGITGRVYIVKNRAGTAITIGTSTAGQTIEGATSISLSSGGTAHFITNGASWFRLN